MDDEPPKLTIAASNDEAELAKREALDLLHWPTREMVANLLRVMRGAGRPTHLPDQIIEVALAIQKAGKHTNAWYIGEEIREVLDSAFPSWADECDRQSAMHTIAQGSLQYLASNLVHQRAQAAAGEREIDSGMKEIEYVRERNRERMRAEQAAYRASLKKPKRTAKPKKPPPPPPAPKTTAEFMRRRKSEIQGRPPKSK